MQQKLKWMNYRSGKHLLGIPLQIKEVITLYKALTPCVSVASLLQKQRTSQPPYTFKKNLNLLEKPGWTSKPYLSGRDVLVYKSHTSGHRIITNSNSMMQY